MRVAGTIAVALGAVLIFAGVSQAATRTLTAGLEGDANSSITIAVKLGDASKPKRVVEVRYANVDLRCDDGSATEVSGTADGGRVKRPKDGGQRFFSAGGPGQGGSASVNVFGRINAKATTIRGDFLAFTGPQGERCSTANGSDLSYSKFVAN